MSDPIFLRLEFHHRFIISVYCEKYVLLYSTYLYCKFVNSFVAIYCKPGKGHLHTSSVHFVFFAFDNCATTLLLNHHMMLSAIIVMHRLFSFTVLGNLHLVSEATVCMCLRV